MKILAPAGQLCIRMHASDQTVLYRGIVLPQFRYLYWYIFQLDWLDSHQTYDPTSKEIYERREEIQYTLPNNKTTPSYFFLLNLPVDRSLIELMGHKTTVGCLLNVNFEIILWQESLVKKSLFQIFFKIWDDVWSIVRYLKINGQQF